MRFLFAILLCLVQAASFRGQPLRGLNHTPQKPEVTSDTLRILAVMVDFQTDNDATTVGTGKFGSIYSKDYGLTILDPLPHDSGYFSNHLLFAKNYFRKVSGGKQVIEYTVLPKVLTLNKKIRDYSPPIKSSDFSGLAQMTDEVWKKADSAFAGFPFSRYSLFTVFHAGVGRDVSVPGSLGNERDLPSVYLNKASLQKYLGTSYEGVSVSGGTYKIANSIILPETESREVETFGSKYLFQISINGLLVASIGSHLGLPDLFDTKTGLSAIGRFGLMDGQSIFAYNGLFPPEPSAWEKYYLGWVSVKTVEPTGGYYLAVNRARQTGTPSVIKVPINASEYFLVENRIRDIDADGVTVTYVLGNQTLTKTFAKDTTGFYAYSIDSIKGIVTDVSDYDWALPGSGVVIWHIDEKIINEKFASNTINADKNKRGVDVEEADGIQDIGEQFTTVFGDVLVGEGAPEDFWFKLNPAKLFKNRFGTNTRPSTLSNNGSACLWEFSDFSNLNDSISFTLTRTGKYISSYWKNNSVGSSNRINSLNTIPVVLSGTSDFQYIAALQGTTLHLILKIGIEKSYGTFSQYPVAMSASGNSGFVCGALDTTVNLAVINNSSISRLSVSVSKKITSLPVIKSSNGATSEFLFGTENGSLYSINLDLANPPFPVARLVETNSQDGALRRIIVTENTLIKVFSDGTQTAVIGAGPSLKIAKAFSDVAVYTDADGVQTLVLLTTDNFFSVYKKGALVTSFRAQGTGNIATFSLLADKRSKDYSIVYTAGNTLYSVNLTGVVNTGFPVKNSNGASFTGSPVAFDYNNDGKEDLLTLSSAGTLSILDGTTATFVEGAPLTIGAGFSTGAALMIGKTDRYLVTADTTNEVAVWTINTGAATTGWTGNFGSPQQTGYAGKYTFTSQVSSFLEKSKVYNYPNPAYEGFTHIRYSLSEDATISIQIYDLAGDKVASLSSNARGGVEQETTWLLDNIQSGVYIAKVTATGVSGKKGEATIKIAVVK